MRKWPVTFAIKSKDVGPNSKGKVNRGEGLRQSTATGTQLSDENEATWEHLLGATNKIFNTNCARIHAGR